MNRQKKFAYWSDFVEAIKNHTLANVKDIGLSAMNNTDLDNAKRLREFFRD